MTNLIVEISKYLIILLMAVYTYLNFRYFAAHTKQGKNRICRKQIQAMLLMHIMGYIVIFLKVMNPEDPQIHEKIVMFYLAQVLFLLGYIYLSRLFYRNISRLLVNNMCMFLSVSFMILTRISLDRALRQFSLVIVAACVTWLIPFIVDRVWQLSKIPWVYGLGGIFVLLVVVVAGTTSFGAQISLQIAGFTFQPSEFVKISFVFFVAAMFYKSTGMVSIVLTTLAAAFHVLILVLSKDLGGALLFFLTYLMMLYIATSNLFLLAGGLLSGSAAAMLAYRLFSHVRVRIAAWQNPWADMDVNGYQITQSLFAIGTGGWFGMGLYQGMPYKIPVVEKDFIFAAISEEMGGIFALCLILICLGCFIQFMMIANMMKAVFYKLIAFGLGMMYIVQVFLAIGGAIKFIPLTGVTLPLVSYGGSSVLSTFILFGIIQGLYILKKNEEDDDEE